MTKSRGGRRVGAGRPIGSGDYRSEYAAQVQKLVRLAATDMEIADFFKVSVRTIYKWRGQFVEFAQALKVGKQEADERVGRSLFQRACGFEHDAVKIMQNDGQPVIVPYREYVIPDTTACIFWLKNRQPKEWRDVQEHKHTGLTLEELVCGRVADDKAPAEEGPVEDSGGLVQ